MNRRSALTALVIALSLASTLTAQDTAAQWAVQQQEALAALNDTALSAILKQGTPTLSLLFAEVKTGYASDPLALTRIAALSQFVMRPAGSANRAAYTDALLAAAQRAPDADVACFFLDQLRWCGLPQQAAAIKVFETSDKPGVAALAAMTHQAVTDDRSSKAAPVKDTPCSALDKELAALTPQALTPRLLKLFDGPDTALAGVALVWARTAGTKAETALWTAKLATVTDPTRKTMLLDTLGARGDTTACAAVSACLADADDTTAAAAQKALITLDPSVFAAQIPARLKSLPPARQALARDGLRQLKTDLIKSALTKSYDSFSTAGKRVALDLFRERRLAETAPLGLAALDAKDEETAIAGSRLLREVAGPSLATALVAKTLASTGRVTPEAQTTLAAAARRDPSGAYAAALVKAWPSIPEAQKPIALETAARLGGATLLKQVEADTRAANAETATAAVRALAVWPDASSLPVLMRLAVTAPDTKRQTLAVRGAAKMFSGTSVNRQALLPIWREIRAQAGNEANKKTIDDLFKEEK